MSPVQTCNNIRSDWFFYNDASFCNLWAVTRMIDYQDAKVDALNAGWNVIWHGRMPFTIVGALALGVRRCELICWGSRHTYRFHNAMLKYYVMLVCLWNSASHIKGGTWIEGVWQQGAEENIWTEERWGDGSLGKMHNEVLHNVCS
jgi:hypothetical protein